MLDKLNALPATQKVAVFVGVLAVVGLVMWQFLISPAGERKGQAAAKKGSKQAELQKLKDFDRTNRLKEAQDRRAAEKAQLDRNTDLLPHTEAIPNLIKKLEAEAEQAGLKFEGFVAGDPEPEDYYLRVPVDIEVLGRTADLIEFLTALSETKKSEVRKEDRRIIDVRELHIRKFPIDKMKIEEALGEVSAFDRTAKIRRAGKAREGLTVEQKRILKMKDWQEANRMNVVRADFVAYVFTYTGKMMSDEQRKKHASRRKRRR